MKRTPAVTIEVVDYTRPPQYHDIRVVGHWDNARRLWVCDDPSEVKALQEQYRLDYERTCTDADSRVYREDHDRWWPLTAGSAGHSTLNH